MDKLEHVAAVILAGGKSTRMGRDKASVELGGRTLLEWTAAKAASIYGRVLVAGPASLARPGLETVDDPYPEAGPLSGLLAGLRAANTPWVQLLPCDSPFIPEPYLRGLATLTANREVVVARSRGFLEPLHALYAAACAPHVQALLEAGEHKIILLYDRVRVLEVGPDRLADWDPNDLAFFNLNSPADLARAEELLRGFEI